MTDPRENDTDGLAEAPNRGVSSQEPAEGADDAPDGTEDSPGE